MKRFKSSNNKGFSLIELIVVVAIMVIMTGVISLSLSLLIGSEAKQASEKISAQINEVKTGAMSRYNEDLSIVYVSDPSAYDWADQEGYYAVKMITTLAAQEEGEVQDPRHPDDPSAKVMSYMPNSTTPELIGIEHRYICNNRVSMDFTYHDAGGDSTYSITADGTSGLKLTFDRATGLYSDVSKDVTCDTDGSATGTEIAGSYPVKLAMKSGARTYTIEFVNETGKHKIVK